MRLANKFMEVVGFIADAIGGKKKFREIKNMKERNVCRKKRGGNLQIDTWKK
jgi:hypothetical protein